jgi:hypothetical protein
VIEPRTSSNEGPIEPTSPPLTGSAQWRMAIPRDRFKTPRLRIPNTERDNNKTAQRQTQSDSRLRADQRFAPRIGYRPSKPLRAVSFMLTFVVVVTAASIWAMGKLGPQLAGKVLSFPVPAGEGWVLQDLRRAGSSKFRRLTIYEPCRTLPMCRMEMNWRSDINAIGLVRWLDARNFDGVRLKRSGGVITEELFSVVSGLESRRVVKTVAMTQSDPDVRVAWEVAGSNVALYLENELVDSRTEEKLSHAAVGFISDRGEKPPAHTIRIVYPDYYVPGNVAASLIKGIKQAGIRFTHALF